MACGAVMIWPGEHRRFLWIALPALAALALVLAAGVPGWRESVTLFVIVVVLTLLAWQVLGRHPGKLRTVANLLHALHRGDYAVRAVVPTGSVDMAQAVEAANALAERLQRLQREAQQGTRLLRKTLAELDTAVFVFDGDGTLQLVNPAGAHVMQQRAERLLGRTAQALGLEAHLQAEAGSMQQLALPAGSGRWQVNTKVIWSGDTPGRLLILQPVERVLRQEEAQAFRRLLRVLGHEINNSMSPIASMAETLQLLLGRQGGDAAPPDPDVLRGLEVIEARSRALQRFVGGYARLAALPDPQPCATDLMALCKAVAALLEAPALVLSLGEAATVWVDRDQLEQVLINLVKNAVEASPQGQVELRWILDGDSVVVQVLDDGPGLPASGNIFVPFFSTKPGGAGIGLVLSRAIVEANGGDLQLAQRQDATGVVASIRLPRHDPASRR
ncbi:ATP-binding protein [Stenotrophomonas sp. G106K1]|uniref:sensor histidine kinase n=1 Tax=Stenotrophomonas sp. G106K1 TaxID=3134792 RepID=UPI0030F49DFE